MKLKDSGSSHGLRVKIVAFSAALTLIGAAIVPVAAMADMTTQQTIDQLSAQIAALQKQLLALSGSSSSSASGACSFTRDLTVGSKGDDVKDRKSVV